MRVDKKKKIKIEKKRVTAGVVYVSKIKEEYSKNNPRHFKLEVYQIKW